MLRSLVIRNVVLIEHLDLRFNDSLCVLTGETGAGKSVFLDAIGLALGARADSKLIRYGETEASVTATFDLSLRGQARDLLQENAIRFDKEDVFLRRVLNIDGTSRAFINDQQVSIGFLKIIGAIFIDVHGQFENQKLLKPKNYRDLLDNYGENGNLKEKVKSSFDNWKKLVSEKNKLQLEIAGSHDEKVYLRDTLEELQLLSPVEGEEETLAKQRRIIANTGMIADALNEALRQLQENGGAEESLNKASRAINKISGKAEGMLDEGAEAIDRSLNEVSEAINVLKGINSGFDSDVDKLEVIEDRLFSLRAIARKNNVQVEGLSNLMQKISVKLEISDEGETRLNSLIRREVELQSLYRGHAKELTQSRLKAAQALDVNIKKELISINMMRSVFTTKVVVREDKNWDANGADDVLFLVSTNPGTPVGPLATVASGGELARFMLSIKVVMAKADPVSAIIFDEVDSGVGGAVASAVGDRLLQLASKNQVLVVTHSPQVAAKGRQHLLVSKQSIQGGATEEEKFFTKIVILNEEERIEEIARMLSGQRITSEARAAANSLLLK